MALFAILAFRFYEEKNEALAIAFVAFFISSVCVFNSTIYEAFFSMVRKIENKITAMIILFILGLLFFIGISYAAYKYDGGNWLFR